MAGAETQTIFRRGVLAAGFVVLAGAGLLCGLWLYREPARLGGLSDSIIPALVGWGTPVAAFRALLEAIQPWRQPAPATPMPHLSLWLSALLSWIAGWFLVGLGIRSVSAFPRAPSAAVGSQLHPALARFQDFHWGTAAAYGGGILGSELALLILQTLLAGRWKVPAPAAFSVSFSVGCAIAFGAGFLGAARSRQISVPEATLSLIYFGLPIPIFLTVLPGSPRIVFFLREIIYLAELLGRPELGYWLVFVGLSLAMVLGITSGFVVTGSGRADVRTGFEFFVARRHVSIFRPRFLVGALLVLMLFIVPPLIILGILLAARRTVERTRIRQLGLEDPLLASDALNNLKMKELAPTAMMTSLSVGAVGLGVMSLVIVLSVMSGFEADLKQKILGTNAAAVITKYTKDFEDYPEVIQQAKQVSGVVGATPIVMKEGLIRSEHGDTSGVGVKGIDPATVGDVTDLPKNILEPGKLEYLDHPEKLMEKPSDEREGLGAGGQGVEDPIIGRRPKGPAALGGVLLGQQLASSLRVTVGDRVTLLSAAVEEIGPTGPAFKARAFRVVGIFYSGMYEYDSKLLYISLRDAQSFFGVKGVSAIELKLADVDQARNAAQAVMAKLDGYPYHVRHWGDLNRNLFSALRLEKLVMAIILTIIVIVAAGLIVATVTMLVLEKRKEIAVLKALGVSDASVVKIFLSDALEIGIAGGMLGLVAGLAGCIFIERVGIRLDPEVYYISALPVKIEPAQTAIAVVIAILTTYLASIYPALKASRVEPVEGLKAE